MPADHAPSATKLCFDALQLSHLRRICSCQAAIPETDDIPAESPWNLNDWIVDFANGGTLGWTALNTQVDGFLSALDLVDWDNALYVCQHFSVPLALHYAHTPPST
jgi:hypothetical protein